MGGVAQAPTLGRVKVTLGGLASCPVLLGKLLPTSTWPRFPALQDEVLAPAPEEVPSVCVRASASRNMLGRYRCRQALSV